MHCLSQRVQNVKVSQLFFCFKCTFKNFWWWGETRRAGLTSGLCNSVRHFLIFSHQPASLPPFSPPCLCASHYSQPQEKALASADNTVQSNPSCPGAAVCHDGKMKRRGQGASLGGACRSVPLQVRGTLPQRGLTNNDTAHSLLLAGSGHSPIAGETTSHLSKLEPKHLHP